MTEMELIMAPPASLTPDFMLTPGVLESGAYGNKFRGATDNDGYVTAGFTASGSDDVVLSFTGYDVDYDDEIEIFVNGVSIGYIDAGGNNALADYQIQISADLLNAGVNEITFSQTGPTYWKWGVTDLLIEPVDPAPDLALNQTNTGSYGNKFNGVFEPDGQVDFNIQATGGDLALHVDGFDIDYVDEVEILLNGTSIGFLKLSEDQSLSSNIVLLSASDLEPGENTISFVQNLNLNFAWGVTNLRLESAVIDAPLPTLDIGVAETGTFGHRYDGNYDTDGKLAFDFQATGDLDLTMTFEGFDIDNDSEVEVLLNGKSLGFLAAGVDKDTASYDLLLATGDLNNGTNTIEFRQSVDVNWSWGVTNLLMEEVPVEVVPPTHLTLGVTETGSFGNKFNGTDTVGEEVAFTFDASGGDMVLHLEGFDIDYADEVEIFLNGTSIGYIRQGLDQALYSDVVLLKASDLEPGQNTISFGQAIDPNFTWGVTNLRLENAVIDQPTSALEFGVADTGTYGHRYNGTYESEVGDMP